MTRRDTCQRLIDINGLRNEVLTSVKCKQLCRELGAPQCRKPHVTKTLRQLSISTTGEPSFNEPEVPKYYGKKIIEVMGDARRQLTHCLQSLHLT
jgi:hypothetical protein